MSTLIMPSPLSRPQPTSPLVAPPLRVGAVSYLNSKPLIAGLDEQLGTACGDRCRRLVCDQEACDSVCRLGGTLTLDVPSRLADELRVGDLDVALIPSVEAITGEGYNILSDACVATRGPVRSVKLYSRVPIGEIRSLALDDGSRTSAALTRTILSEKYGVDPELQPFPLGSSIGDCDADAVLMIGDRAMHEPEEPFAVVWDLGEQWFKWTGRPFVFAVWVARAGVGVDHVAKILSRARDQGVATISEIARESADPLGLTPADAERYLRKNLHFHLRRAERASLGLFARLARQAGVIA